MITDVEEVIVEQEEINIYPNPASSIVNIGMISNNTTDAVRIFDSNGQLKRSILSEGSAGKIDISNLPSGLYYLELDTKNGKTIQSKFIKI